VQCSSQFTGQTPHKTDTETHQSIRLRARFDSWQRQETFIFFTAVYTGSVVFIQLPIQWIPAARHPDVNLTTHLSLMRGDELPPTVRLHDVALNQARPTHLSLLDMTILITRLRVHVMKLSSRIFSQPPITSPLCGPNILLSTLFSNPLSIRDRYRTHTEPMAIL
jgi:hypothetical protein